MLIVKADSWACDQMLAQVLKSQPPATGINAYIITEASPFCFPLMFEAKVGGLVGGWHDLNLSHIINITIHGIQKITQLRNQRKTAN